VPAKRRRLSNLKASRREALEDRDESDENIDWVPKVDTEVAGAHNVDLVFSDSGYRSGQGTDTESICSLNSTQGSVGLPHDVLQDFIALIGNALIGTCGARHWAEYASAHHSADVIEKQVGSAMKWYTKQLMQARSAFEATHVSFGSDIGGPNRDILAGATNLVRPYKPCIARYFRDNVSTVPVTATLLDILLHSLGSQLSLPERLELSPRLAASHEDSILSGLEDRDDDEIMEDAESQDEEDALFANLELVRNTFVNNDAFRVLLLKLRRTLYDDDRSEMERIKTVMMEDSLLGSGSGSHQASFIMHWPMADFMRSQYGEEIPRIGSVVVIIGSTLYAQATTCAE
jgi:hypothetical protein